MARTGDGTRIPLLGTYGGAPTFAADLTQISSDAGSLIGESVATVLALPASGNWVGRTITVTGADNSYLKYVWTGTAWVRSSSLSLGGVNGNQLGTGTTAGTRFLFQFGSNVGTADAAGDGINVIFATPFPSGVVMAMAVNGDSSAQNEMTANVVNVTKTGFGVHVSARSKSVRINWIAVGW